MERALYFDQLAPLLMQQIHYLDERAGFPEVFAPFHVQRKTFTEGHNSFPEELAPLLGALRHFLFEPAPGPERLGLCKDGHLQIKGF